MNRELALLLTALGDFLHRRRTELAQREYEWYALFQCGTKHRLNAIVFYQLGDQIPEPAYSDFYTEYLASIVRFRHRQEIVGQMEAVLQRSGVDHFYVKGDLIGALYTNPMLRTMSDVDLMVPANQLASLHDPLVEAGFVRTVKGNSVWTYCKETLTFELHNSLIESSHREDDSITDYLSHCWDYVDHGKLDWNVHMIYLLLHLRKHFRAAGVGFRQFLDLAFVARTIPLDWDYIRREMEQLGLWRFTVTVMNLCDLWFDADCAPERLDLEREFVEQTTDTIFRNGVFGFANEENRENDMINTVRSEGIPGLLKRFVQSLFPSYRELRVKRKFRFLHNRPWLLPLAWIWHMILYFAEGKAVKDFLNFLRFRDTIASRNDTFKKWGL